MQIPRTELLDAETPDILIYLVSLYVVKKKFYVFLVTTALFPLKSPVWHFLLTGLQLSHPLEFLLPFFSEIIEL
jgi:hypothetical protein